MKLKKLVVTPFFLILGFIFFNIYQHNKIVRMVYKKQRIDRQKEVYLRSKNNLFSDLCRIASQTKTKKKAANWLGMKPLNIKQISNIDFVIANSDKSLIPTDGILSGS